MRYNDVALSIIYERGRFAEADILPLPECIIVHQVPNVHMVDSGTFIQILSMKHRILRRRSYTGKKGLKSIFHWSKNPKTNNQLPETKRSKIDVSRPRTFLAERLAVYFVWH